MPISSWMLEHFMWVFNRKRILNFQHNQKKNHFWTIKFLLCLFLTQKRVYIIYVFLRSNLHVVFFFMLQSNTAVRVCLIYSVDLRLWLYTPHVTVDVRCCCLYCTWIFETYPGNCLWNKLACWEGCWIINIYNCENIN